MRRLPEGASSANSGMKFAGFVEKFFRLVALHPVFEHLHVIGILCEVGERNLVRAPRIFDWFAVDHLRAGPTFRRAHNDHRPSGQAL